MARLAAGGMALARPPWALALAACALCVQLASAQPNIDGGRGDLPGMKQDIFDQVNKQKRAGPQRPGKGPPDCPKSDKMIPFQTMAFAEGELFVRLDSSEGPCHKLVTVGGANFTELMNASKTCGPAGEWKKRIAEEMSAVFFQGGFEWVKSENDTIEVVTENGTFAATVNEEKYGIMMQCWKQSCGCEQAANPKMKLVLISLFVIAFGCLSFDSVKLAWDWIKGKKPPKHVLCKKGHRMHEVKFAYSHLCDICRKSGTCYQCSVSCNYDMCKTCYKSEKKKTRAKLKEWLEKHPEDEDNKKKDKEDEDKDEDEAKKDDSQSEAGDKDAKKESEPDSDAPKKESDADAESDAPPDSSEADKDGAAAEEDEGKKE